MKKINKLEVSINKYVEILEVNKRNQKYLIEKDRYEKYQKEMFKVLIPRFVYIIKILYYRQFAKYEKLYYQFLKSDKANAEFKQIKPTYKRIKDGNGNIKEEIENVKEEIKEIQEIEEVQQRMDPDIKDKKEVQEIKKDQAIFKNIFRGGI